MPEAERYWDGICKFYTIKHANGQINLSVRYIVHFIDLPSDCNTRLNFKQANWNLCNHPSSKATKRHCEICFIEFKGW